MTDATRPTATEERQMKMFEVRSDRDNGVVFDAVSVEREARLLRVRPLVAARRLAKQNEDEVMGERLFVVEVSA